jgi:hypothetical protein
VVHQVWPPRNAARRKRQGLDLVDASSRRRRDRRARRPVVEVVQKPDADAACGSGAQSPEHDLLRLVEEVDVVDRDVQRLLGRFEERRKQLRDLDRPLSAVDERAEVDQDCCARSFALYARFAAW